MKKVYEKVLEKQFHLKDIKEVKDLERSVWNEAKNPVEVRTYDEIQADDIDSVIKLAFEETAKEIFADLENSLESVDKVGIDNKTHYLLKVGFVNKFKKKYLGEA